MCVNGLGGRDRVTSPAVAGWRWPAACLYGHIELRRSASKNGHEAMATLAHVSLSLAGGHI
jgi:hypothetical protein